MCPPRPTSTLFPYTTLFRSRGARPAGPRAHAVPAAPRAAAAHRSHPRMARPPGGSAARPQGSEEHTSELQSPYDVVCRLLLEKKVHGGTHARKPCEDTRDKD